MSSWKKIWAQRKFASDNQYPTEHFQAFVRHHVSHLLEEKIHSGADERPVCLDFGCGSGANSQYAVSCGLDTIAVDLSKHALRLALGRLEDVPRSTDGYWGTSAFYAIEDIVEAGGAPIQNRRLTFEGGGEREKRKGRNIKRFRRWRTSATSILL